MKQLNIDPALLIKNSWNSNHLDPEIERRLEASIQKFGLFKPIIVREIDEGFEIIGGEHRAEVAQRLGVTEVPVINLGSITDEKAKEISLIDNTRYGHDDSNELAEILKTLDADSVTSVMPIDLSEIEALTKSSVEIDLDEIGFDKTEEKIEPEIKIPKSHTLLRVKIPVDKYDEVMEILDSVAKDHGITETDKLIKYGDVFVSILEHFKGVK